LTGVDGDRGRSIVGILTIIPEEFEAVRRLLGTHQNIPGGQYFVAQIAAPDASGLSAYEVVVCQSAGQTNLTASDIVRDFIEDFRPEYLLLVGIAGGHGKREVRLGDVVIADFVEDSEYFKLSDGKSLHRKRAYDHPSYKLRQLYAEPLSKISDWHQYIDTKRPNKKPPRAVVANLASGEKLLGDRKNAYQKMIISHFDKAAVFEMEGFGVASQVFKQRGSVHYNPQYLIIRGVSDLVNEKSNQATRNKWKNYAACAAAAFARALVEKILATRTALEP
jgi:adenosylhomocysteine nucleosidase